MNNPKKLFFSVNRVRRGKKSFFLKNLIQKHFSITKRHKFVISVVILSLGLFFLEHLLGRSGLYLLIFLSLLTDIFLFWAIHDDLKNKNLIPVFLLPFLLSLSFGLFYFLVPARFLTRIAITSIYAVSLYSLFLSQNIFVISKVRSIALLSSARIVSFILAVLSYFFLANIVFSFHLFILPMAFLVLFFSFLLVFHSLWIYSGESLANISLWSIALSICLFELSFILWFWPSDPTVMALFFTGFFYTIVGLSHVWFDKRLFRNVLWEYIWVSVIVLFILILFTSWGA